MEYRSQRPVAQPNDFTIDVAPSQDHHAWSSRSSSPDKELHGWGPTDFEFETRDVEKNPKSYAHSIAASTAKVVQVKEANPKIPIGASISGFIHEWTPFGLVFSYFVFSTGERSERTNVPGLILINASDLHCVHRCIDLCVLVCVCNALIVFVISR
jgi:hypothetical protein